MEEKEKNPEEKNFKLIYKIIQNQIKDYIINKYISIIKNQNEIIKEIQKSNEILKKNYLFVLKKALIKEDKIKSNNSLSKNKNFLNISYKLTDFSKNSEKENLSLSLRNSSIDEKVSKTYKLIMNKKNISSSFILKKNISLNNDIFPINYKKKINKNSFFQEKEVNKSLQIHNSQKIISNFVLIKRNSSDKNQNNSFRRNNDLINFSEKKKKEKNQKNQKIFDNKNNNKISNNHRSYFLANKIYY